MAEIENELSDMDELAHGLAFAGVQLTRIYDVLLANLGVKDREVADYIERLHKGGGTISAIPYFNNEVFQEESETE